MLNRYSRKEMRDIWSEESKFGAWLKVELLACEAWSELGEIPKEDVEKLWKMQSLILIGFMRSNSRQDMMLWHLHVVFRSH